MSNIIIKNLHKNFDSENGSIVRAVKDVSLEIKEGSFTTLLGPSGCGKTTILRMIAGFEIPTSGEIIIDNQDVSSLSPDKRNTAMVFQSYALFPHLSVFENIAYGLRLQKLSEKEIKRRVFESMKMVNLKGYENRSPNQLSGGQQQRVALARALVMRPAVLLFDEPLSNLDAKLRIFMRNEIRRIQQELKITAVYVTHDQSEAMSISDQVVVMNEGEIEQVGNPKEIYHYPESSFVADFIGQSNIIEATVLEYDEDYVYLQVGDIKIKSMYQKRQAIGEKTKLILRPENLKIHDSKGYKAQVISSVFMGSYHDYYLDFQGQVLNVQIPDPRNLKVYEENQICFVQIDPDKTYCVLT